MAPVVHFKDGIIHALAFYAVFEFVVEPASCTVKGFIVYAQRKYEMSEKQIGYNCSP